MPSNKPTNQQPTLNRAARRERKKGKKKTKKTTGIPERVARAPDPTRGSDPQSRRTNLTGSSRFRGNR